MSQPKSHSYEFGPFRLDLSERQLFRDGTPVSLTRKDFETLAVLVKKSGHVVEKDDLLKEVWADAFVEEANISRHVWTLRKTLGESEEGLKYIETVPRRGYRFTADVREVGDGGEQLVLERHSVTHVIAEEDDDEAAGPGRGIAQDFGRKSPAASSEKQESPRWRRGLSFGVLCALVLGLGAALYHTWTSRETERGQAGVAATAIPRSIAVLPFKTMGEGDNNEYLGMGMTDALITRLGNVSQVLVRPTSAVRKYLGVEKGAASVGQELQVESVLEGSVQRSGDRIRVTVQLIRVSDGAQVWGDKFDDTFTNVFALQDSISEKMAAALELKLTSEEQKRLTKRYTDNVEAYQLYLKGRYHVLKLTPPEIQTGISYFQQAIAIDPSYALAYVGLADAYRSALVGDMPATAFLPQAKAAAQRAIEIDDTLADAHAELGFIIFWYDWDWNAAENQFKRALELNPNDADGHLFYAHLLSNTGRHAEALAEVRRARELDPLNLRTGALEGQFLIHAGRTDEALAGLQKTLELEPNFGFAHLFASSAYIEKGMYPEAIAEGRKARELNGANSHPVAFLGYALAKSGKQAEARAVLAELLNRSKERYVPPYNIALVYNGLDERDETLAWLERGFEQRDPKMVFLKVEPKWNDLRSDQRFQDLLRRVGFMP
jgi:TolB-like protein/DNA-binding winged helix-turn-helix (wHTH) protein/Tfp pilus assembly protein PilF